jgi:gas vesicle protein
MGKLAKKFAIGALIAGSVGYVAGILTAPKSGQETRKDIKNEVTKRISEAEKELKVLLVDLNKIIDEAKNVADKFSGTARKDLDELVSVAKESKEKARKLLSAVHEGDAEDKELHTAIKEANAAIDHIKDFLKK